MLVTRYAKVAMSFVLAAFCLIVAFDNITDYGSNYPFVQHVLSMDTTYPGNRLMYRAITSPTLWQLAYAVIIAAEAVAGALFLLGGIRLWQARHAPGPVFNQAKGFTVGACLLAFLIWGFGFMVVAGEWFAMWQSETWNAQEPAFRILVTVLAVLIFVNQQDGDLPGPAPAKQAAPKRQRSNKE